MKKRVWEIDLLRVIAIVLMILFHFVYDLRIFAGLEINYTSGFWYWVGKTAALLFICISGISTGFSSRGTVRSGIKLLSLGMVVSLATYVVFGEQYVRFGILHFLGTCILVYPLLVRISSWMLVCLAVIIVWIAQIVENLIVDTYILLPFGLRYSGFSTVDYYPLLPYLAVYILGVLMYKVYYFQKKSLFSFDYSNPLVTLLSQHSLLIYLLHQPVLIAVILIIKQFM